MPVFWQVFSDLNALKATGQASLAVMGLDAAFVGTTDYMGVASFWNYEYQHYLRDATCKQWQRAHTAMLKGGCWSAEKATSTLQSSRRRPENDNHGGNMSARLASCPRT